MDPDPKPKEKTAGPPAAKPPLPPMKLPPPPDSQRPAPSAAADDTSSMAQSLAATITDDKDVIEKEWVNKAKQIVQNNRNDPYRQSEELMIFRANYMRKRYGKDIKLSK